jgi:hypothetical protein
VEAPANDASRRSPPTIRWLRVTFRSLHIPAAGLVLGALWLGNAEAAWGMPLVATAITGALLAITFFFQSPAWLLEVRGLVLVAKLAVLAALPAMSPAGAFVVLLVLTVVAAISSHMPGKFRHFRCDSWWRSRRPR